MDEWGAADEVRSATSTSGVPLAHGEAGGERSGSNEAAAYGCASSGQTGSTGVESSDGGPGDGFGDEADADAEAHSVYAHSERDEHALYRRSRPAYSQRSPPSLLADFTSETVATRPTPQLAPLATDGSLSGAGGPWSGSEAVVFPAPLPPQQQPLPSAVSHAHGTRPPPGFSSPRGEPSHLVTSSVAPPLFDVGPASMLPAGPHQTMHSPANPAKAPSFINAADVNAWHASGERPHAEAATKLSANARDALVAVPLAWALPPADETSPAAPALRRARAPRDGGPQNFGGRGNLQWEPPLLVLPGAQSPSIDAPAPSLVSSRGAGAMTYTRAAPSDSSGKSRRSAAIAGAAGPLQPSWRPSAVVRAFGCPRGSGAPLPAALRGPQAAASSAAGPRHLSAPPTAPATEPAATAADTETGNPSLDARGVFSDSLLSFAPPTPAPILGMPAAWGHAGLVPPAFTVKAAAAASLPFAVTAAPFIPSAGPPPSRTQAPHHASNMAGPTSLASPGTTNTHRVAWTLFPATPPLTQPPPPAVGPPPLRALPAALGGPARAFATAAALASTRGVGGDVLQLGSARGGALLPTPPAAPGRPLAMFVPSGPARPPTLPSVLPYALQPASQGGSGSGTVGGPPGFLQPAPTCPESPGASLSRCASPTASTRTDPSSRWSALALSGMAGGVPSHSCAALSCADDDGDGSPRGRLVRGGSLQGLLAQPRNSSPVASLRSRGHSPCAVTSLRTRGVSLPATLADVPLAVRRASCSPVIGAVPAAFVGCHLSLTAAAGVTSAAARTTSTPGEPLFGAAALAAASPPSHRRCYSSSAAGTFAERLLPPPPPPPVGTPGPLVLDLGSSTTASAAALPALSAAHSVAWARPRSPASISASPSERSPSLVPAAAGSASGLTSPRSTCSTGAAAASYFAAVAPPQPSSGATGMLAASTPRTSAGSGLCDDPSGTAMGMRPDGGRLSVASTSTADGDGTGSLPPPLVGSLTGTMLPARSGSRNRRRRPRSRGGRGTTALGAASSVQDADGSVRAAAALGGQTPTADASPHAYTMAASEPRTNSAGAPQPQPCTRACEAGDSGGAPASSTTAAERPAGHLGERGTPAPLVDGDDDIGADDLAADWSGTPALGKGTGSGGGGGAGGAAFKEFFKEIKLREKVLALSWRMGGALVARSTNAPFGCPQVSLGAAEDYAQAHIGELPPAQRWRALVELAALARSACVDETWARGAAGTAGADGCPCLPAHAKDSLDAFLRASRMHMQARPQHGTRKKALRRGAARAAEGPAGMRDCSALSTFPSVCCVHCSRGCGCLCRGSADLAGAGCCGRAGTRAGVDRVREVRGRARPHGALPGRPRAPFIMLRSTSCLQSFGGSRHGKAHAARSHVLSLSARFLALFGVRRAQSILKAGLEQCPYSEALLIKARCARLCTLRVALRCRVHSVLRGSLPGLPPSLVICTLPPPRTRPCATSSASGTSKRRALCLAALRTCRSTGPPRATLGGACTAACRVRSRDSSAILILCGCSTWRIVLEGALLEARASRTDVARDIFAVWMPSLSSPSPLSPSALSHLPSPPLPLASRVACWNSALCGRDPWLGLCFFASVPRLLPAAVPHARGTVVGSRLLRGVPLRGAMRML